MSDQEHEDVLKAQLPSSSQSSSDEVQGNQQHPDPDPSHAPSQAAHQKGTLRHIHVLYRTPESSKEKKTEQAPPTPTSQPQPQPHPSSLTSPSYTAHFTPWPFVATSPRALTPMPYSITQLLAHNLSSQAERITAAELWNPSLPTAANVGIVLYNRVSGAEFRRRSDGEGGWWRGLEELRGVLNEAGGVVRGEGNGGAVGGDEEGRGKGKGLEKETSGLQTGRGGGFEDKSSSETDGKVGEPGAAATAAGPNSKPTKFTTEEGQVASRTKSDDDSATEAAMSLLSLSSNQADNNNNLTLSPPALAASTNALSALWYLIDRFFSSGPSAASYFFVALEASIRHLHHDNNDKNNTNTIMTVHPLHIPAPPSFWSDYAVPWTLPKTGMALILTLASPPHLAFDAFAHFSRSLGGDQPGLSVSHMRIHPSTSLRLAVLRAKDAAVTKSRTTILGVNLRDVLHAQLCEVHGWKEIENVFATFARMFVLGVCPGGGAKLWLVGGESGDREEGEVVGSVWEGNGKVGSGVGTWEEMDEFVRAFEGFAVSDAHWNTKRFKWYRRCFALDLKQFDLQIDEAEKRKRGMQPKSEGTKILFSEIEAWVEIYKIEDVRGVDVGKFVWL